MRFALLAILGALVFGGGALLLSGGFYGLELFVMVPLFLGALAECCRRSPSGGGAAGVGALTVFVANAALLVLGQEGLICIAMSIPLTVPLGAIGAYLTYAVGRSQVPGNEAATFFLLLPLGAGALDLDLTAKPPVYEARTSVEIAAAPEQVWKYVVAFSEMPPPEEWFFKAGIGYPERVGIEGSGVGATRYCEFSTGPFVEPITIWDEPRLLEFNVTESPASMHELSPYGEVSPKHLHGYMISKRGQFRLTPLGNGHTLLIGTSWYQHGLWPAQYWRLWSDAIVHRVHLRVLNNIRTLAEADAARAR